MAKASQEFLDCLAVLKLAGNVSKPEYLDAMWKMDWRYPGRGWGDQATKLEAFYETLKQDQPLSDLDRLIASVLGDLKPPKE